MTGPLYVSNTGKLIFDWSSKTDSAMFVLRGAEECGIRYHEGEPDIMKFSASGNASSKNADLCINGAGEGTVTIRGQIIAHAGNFTSFPISKSQVTTALGYTPSTTNHTHDLSVLINDLGVGTSVPTDNDYVVCQYVGGGTTQTSYWRRPWSVVSTYMINKSYNISGTQPSGPKFWFNTGTRV